MHPKKPPRPAKGAGPSRPRPRNDGAHAVGGSAHRRKGGSMQRVRRGRLLIPQQEEILSEGYRFSAEPASAKQVQQLSKIVTNFLRRDFLNRNQHLPNEVLSEALGMKPRNAAYMLETVRKGECRPAADLVVDVLHGMLTGRVAGILGTRKDTTSRWLFKLVNDFDLTERDMRNRLCVDDAGEPAVDRVTYFRNCQDFTRVHSAFRLEYMTWLRRK